MTKEKISDDNAHIPLDEFGTVTPDGKVDLEKYKQWLRWDRKHNYGAKESDDASQSLSIDWISR